MSANSNINITKTKKAPFLQGAFFVLVILMKQRKVLFPMLINHDGIQQCYDQSGTNARNV